MSFQLCDFSSFFFFNPSSSSSLSLVSDKVGSYVNPGLRSGHVSVMKVQWDKGKNLWLDSG